MYNNLYLAPPFGKTRRIQWTEEKIKLAFSLFGKYINNFTLPSLKEITLKTRNNILKNRQPAAIKFWLHNQFVNNKLLMQNVINGKNYSSTKTYKCVTWIQYWYNDMV